MSTQRTMIRFGLLAAALMAASQVGMTIAAAQDRVPPIDYGTLRTYFAVLGSPRVETIEFVDPLGHVSYHRAYSFLVESTRSFMVAPMFLAEFHDRDGIQLATQVIEMRPMPVYAQPGTRARANFLLPSPQVLARTHRILIKDMWQY